MRRLFIVRHGNTFSPGETPRRVGARTDIPLVPSGVAQAEVLGAWFANHGVIFTRAIASPLLRTRQTAQAVLAASPAPCQLEFADFLKEIDHGPDENLPEDDVIARIGQGAIDAWDKDARSPDDWIVNRDDRIKAWRDFLDADRTGTVLLVTSNGAARFALLAAGLSPSTSPLKLRTGAYGEIVQSAGKDIDIIGWNLRPESISS